MQIAGGKAVPGQPVDPELGGAGINSGECVNTFTAETKNRSGDT